MEMLKDGAALVPGMGTGRRIFYFFNIKTFQKINQKLFKKRWKNQKRYAIIQIRYMRLQQVKGGMKNEKASWVPVIISLLSIAKAR